MDASRLQRLRRIRAALGAVTRDFGAAAPELASLSRAEAFLETVERNFEEVERVFGVVVLPSASVLLTGANASRSLQLAERLRARLNFEGIDVEIPKKYWIEVKRKSIIYSEMSYEGLVN